ncbi:hypothetical protein COLO4_31077 [Corchorus olitorius]|uniref:Uncharacterized protein n=1 Tax=Corchorus olitorius TaxID=93759 RepID=A0A1R3H5R8_9ROSI|nr:hypothetical protein COLO4_31077 [Corchorus olitorius]
MMGFTFTNRSSKHFFAFLLILVAFFLVSSFPSPASCNGDHQILPKKNTLPNNNPGNQPPAAAAYQVLLVKNTTPFYLNKRSGFDKKRKRKMMKRRKKNSKIKNFETRPFSVMLPKGFVPPSGSSPCHNDKPDSSVIFFCGLSAAKP